MSSWLFGWLPGFPVFNLALPSSIQGRFVSYVLKTLLGNFVKPGQFDIHQIDSQVGSGFVQVNDLQLESAAINALLSDLPVELYDGSIASVVAQIPWPNPLTSNLGFSVRSLHLTFHLLPTSSGVPHIPAPDLSSSVASIAESFVHGELTPREERFIRESIHPDLPTSPFHHFSEDGSNIPGSIDPFLSAEDEGFQSDTDPEGVSIFAALIERLLARFEFDAVDTKITLVHPGKASFTVTISETRYGTESKDISGNGESTDQATGETRRISVSGISITSRNLERSTVLSSPLTPSSLSTQPAIIESGFPSHSPEAVSRSSSSSSLDEETQIQMSQSILSLPPRPPSPASSIAGSMYQSAISTVPTGEDYSPDINLRDRASSSHLVHEEESSSPVDNGVPFPHGSVRENEKAEDNEMLLSVTGNPVVIQLTTPLPRSVVKAEPASMNESEMNVPSSQAQSQSRKDAYVKGGDKLQFSLDVSTIACALRVWHIQRITDLLDAWTSHRPLKASSAPESRPMPTPSTLSRIGLDAIVRVRHVVVILSPSCRSYCLHQSSGHNTGSLEDRFFIQPLSPPNLEHEYVRGFFEGLSLSLALEASPSNEILTDQRKPDTTRNSRGSTVGSSRTVMDLTISISELSVLSFHSTPLSSGSTMLASPILITDRHLPSQYSAAHIHPHTTTAPSDEHRQQTYPSLPTFDAIDWTIEKHQRNGFKLSTWRCKSKSSKRQYVRQESQDASRPTDSDRGSTAEFIDHGGKDKRASQTSSPAISVHIVTSISSNTKSRPERIDGVDITTVPLHAFLDLAMMLQPNGFSSILDEILNFFASRDGSSEGIRSGDHNDNDHSTSEAEDGCTPPATPGLLDEKALAKERLRLERLVLQDLDLDDKHPRKKGSKYSKRSGRKDSKGQGSEIRLRVTLPMVRLEIRTPSPSSFGQRSGALVVDFHDTVLSIGSREVQKPSTRFAGTKVPFSSSTILSAECRRIVMACSPTGIEKATAFLSVGPYIPAREPVYDDTTLPISSTPGTHSDRPRVSFNKSHRSTHNTPEILVLIVALPSAHVLLSKAILDDLQYWADDASQVLERVFGGGSGDSENADSRDTSLIGSRYFAMSKRSDSDGASTIGGRRVSPNTETVVKIAISEAYIRLMVSRDCSHDAVVIRPLDIFGSHVDVLMEFNPDEKDETVITVGVMDLNVIDISATGSITRFLSSTSPRSLLATTKSTVKLRLTSLVVPETTIKESRIKLTLSGLTFNVIPDFGWITHLIQFFKAPPNVFESVIPSERTRVSLKVMDGSIRMFAPVHPGALLLHFGELDLSTDIVGDSQESSFHLNIISAYILFLDEPVVNVMRSDATGTRHLAEGVAHWKESGYALLSEISDMGLIFKANAGAEPPATDISVDRISLLLHLCADTMSTVTTFMDDFGSIFRKPVDERFPKAKRQPATITEVTSSQRGILSSVDEHAFRRIPEVGPAPDMINDDLPTNLDYLDESFGTAAGMREWHDDDLDDFNDDEDMEIGRVTPTPHVPQAGIISKIGGETIKILRQEGIQIIENFFENLPPDTNSRSDQYGETTLSIRLHNCDVVLFLYDGFDWARTRQTIENEVKNMRRRLAKIRQLIATGQTQDPSVEETGTLLFNSVYIGLQESVDELEPGALIAAIDEELNDELETASQSSWQSFRPAPLGEPRPRSLRVHGKRLTRSKGPCMEFRFSSVDAEIDYYRPSETLLSRTLVKIKDVEILDHIKTSTWQKFLTELRVDSRGNVRETDSNMVRIELRSVRPVPGHPSEEARLRAKILPLRLYVDQDALDFLKRFFSFEDSQAPASKASSSDGDIYFQFAEIFPVDLKLDYKPRRVDYRALKEGRTIELMNFFHFDGAEMTLRHITLSGITGWPKLFDLLNDLWTPDVKATQLMDVISGVSPIRSVVNVGSGVADLVLLPIAQYKKDGRIVRGMQKGTTAFVKSTAMEAIKLGVRLATGTQVIFEQAEGVLGSQFRDPITAETLQVPTSASDIIGWTEDEEHGDRISKYAEQPADIKEGVQTAYRSLRRNFSSAAQTILAVPMEVYERSGSEGPVRAVIRAVPIAVLKPMIGVTEAVSKTLLGIHNSLDPGIRHETEAKYKHR